MWLERTKENDRWSFRSIGQLVAALLRKRGVASFVSISSSLCLIGFAWYFCSTHRIFSIGDLGAVTFQLTLQPPSSRCLAVNSSRSRCLPNIFLLGASKAGTTSLSVQLFNIPHVHFVRRHIHAVDHHLESHRFDRPSYPRAWKRVELAHELAASPIQDSRVAPQSLVVHYTPHYLYAPSVPRDVAFFYPPRMQPDMRFVVLLRDPIDRALSSYWFKNSHIFKDKDGGSVEEFLLHVKEATDDRFKYESCILEFYNQHAQYGLQYTRLPGDWERRNATAVRDSYLSLLLSVFTASQQLLRHGYPVLFSPLRPPPTNVRVSGLHVLQYDHERALEHCFGAERFRSPSLGLRHWDKSIYVDQFVRWALYFPIEHFIVVASSAYFASPKHVLRGLLSRLKSIDRTANELQRDIQSALNASSLASRRLRQPNALSSQPQNQLSSMDRRALEDYLTPYTELLKIVLKDADKL